MEIIERLPFTQHSIYPILLIDCRERHPYFTWGKPESQWVEYHTIGYTVGNPPWTWHTTLPSRDEGLLFQELIVPGTSDITEPVTSRGKWKLRAHLVQPQTINDKTEVQRDICGQGHEDCKKRQSWKKLVYFTSTRYAYWYTIFIKFTSMFIVHKTFKIILLSFISYTFPK